MLYAGHDLHGADSIGPFEIEVDSALEREAIASRLRDGDFRVRARGQAHRADTVPRGAHAARLAIVRGVYVAYGWLRKLPVIGNVLGYARSTFKGS